MLRLVLASLVGAFLLVGCGDSHDPPADGGISFDAAGLDVGPTGRDAGPGTDAGPGFDAGRDAYVAPPECGNSRLEAGEECDDGGTNNGDGCDENCDREPYCGDDNMDAGEVCDDGNNASGDGCRSDCLSDETCGNGIRDVARGELCDDGPGGTCADDCRSETGCPDGTPVAPETCDDDNTTPWDGCGIDCRKEHSVVVSALSIGGATEACDYSGDGRPDNALGVAFGGARGFLNNFIQMGVTDGNLILLMTMPGLDDPSGAADTSLRVAVTQGEDADEPPNASNNLTGSGTFFGAATAFDGTTGAPLTSLEGRIAARMLTAGPEDISIALPVGGFALPLELRQGRVRGTTTAASGGDLNGITNGLLCGAIPVNTLASVPNPLGMLGGGDPPPGCDGMAETSFADVLVGGALALGIVRIGPATPDVDLDGDGLETFEVDDSGSAGCQPVISACIDGDGTRIAGHGCASDPRFVDGFSAGLPFTAVRASIVGVR